MYKERTKEKIYNICIAEGSFIPLASIDTEQIKSIVHIALMDLFAVQQWLKIAKKDGLEWNAIYKLHYDILHELIEAFLRFDKMKVRTHECLFVFLCEKHPELELDWDFFEKIRTKRNGSIYYGKALSYQDWEEIKLQMNLYISTIQKVLKERLK
ncbi:MAG TPA: hypothetical protein HA294_00395 [Nanoarchaeota archaeon]|nr:hypothetical protein [Candidatus Woesearchaeota archaeon]HIH58446.1 hypothetical protein [Nanoarchaeota archaeon]